MDTSLQTSFAECIIDGYKQTADGVDDRQQYWGMEYEEAELERLEAIPEHERTPEEQAKLDVLLMKEIVDAGGCGTVRDVPLNEYTKTNINMDNAIYVYNQLIAAGFTKQAAAAVMGNLDIENSFSTAWSGDQGSVGIAQWREDRKILLEQFAKQIGGNPTDIKVQVRFLIEKDLPKQLKKEGYEEFKNMTDYIDAADYFCHYVERPARSKDYDAWLNGKYGPNYAQHGGTYMIKWERYEWSEQLQLYELDLKGRRTAAKHWYETMQ